VFGQLQLSSGRTSRWWLGALMIALLTAVFVEGPVSAADRLEKLERETSFHIESGPLESALIQFSRQSGIQVVLSTQVTGISVQAIDGRRNAREVLNALLSATGMTFAIVGQTVTVYATDSRRRAAGPTRHRDSVKNLPN
jgi:hypothetical protein